MNGKQPVALLVVVCCVLSCALAATFVWTPAWSDPADSEKTSRETALTDAQIQTIVDYVLQSAAENNGVLKVTPESITAATGIELSGDTAYQVLPRVIVELQKTTAGRALLKQDLSDATCSVGETSSSCSVPGSGVQSRCAEYGACSLYGDLSSATGDALDMYVQEKATDGQRFEGRALPAFEAQALDGRVVASQSLVGRPTIVVTLAVHCSHSYDTLPILQELERTYGPKGFDVVGIYVNSGSVDDVNTWIDHYAPEYDVWVSPTDGLGKVMDSRLVPTYFLVDAHGAVREKLVGFKTQAEVEERLQAMRTDAPGAVASDSE